MMENFNKMIMIPYEEFKRIIENCLTLAKQTAYNEDFELKINEQFMKNTNIIDYLLNKNEDLKYKKEFNKYLNENKLYTKKSPVYYKMKNNKNTKDWIQI